MATRIAHLFLSIALLVVPRTWRADVQRDLTEEADNAGLSGAWMCRQAIAIGLRMRWREDTADVTATGNAAGTLDMLAQDVRFALRTFLRQPTWTLTVVATLAIGIGANAAMFSVLKDTILSPLPYRNADRLVIPQRAETNGRFNVSPQASMIRAWADHSRTLEGVESYRTREVTWTGAGDPTMLHAAEISDTFPAFAGVSFVAGRGFGPDEMAGTGAPVAVLSEGLWRDRYAANPSILGSTIVLDMEVRTVIGVISRDVRLPSQLNGQPRPDVFMPMAKGGRQLGALMIARLAPGGSLHDAEVELDAIVASQGVAEGLGGMSFRTKLYRPGGGLRDQQSLAMLSAAVGLVLLLACLNVAHLLIARGLSREREFSIRASLGAGRARLARQVLTECVALTIVGGLLGLVVGFWMLRALVALRPASLEALTLAEMDWSVVGVSAFAVVVIGVIFGIVSAWRTTSGTIVESLRSSNLTSSESRAKGRLRAALVLAEVAGAAILLVGSALLVRSVFNLQRVDVGFDARHTFSLNVPLPADRCSPRSPDYTGAFCRSIASQWIERLRAIPGVNAASLALTAPPYTRGFALDPWEVQDDAAPVGGGQMPTLLNTVQPGYFDALGLKLIEGRQFTDASESQHEVVISESLAKRLWVSGKAVGKQMRLFDGSPDPSAPPQPWFTVVGVLADAAVQDVRRARGGLVLYRSSATPGYSAVIRTQRGFEPAQAIRAIALDMNASLALPTVTNIARAYDSASVAESRFTMMLLLAFAAIGLTLCAVGLYGVVSHLVSQQTREIGIRIALGSTRAGVARLVLRRAMAVSLLGTAIGLGAAAASVPAIRSTLFGVTPSDPLTYVAVGVVLLIICGLACVPPLTRALRIDPLVATRTE